MSIGHVNIDGSKMKANASKHKAMSRDRMKQEIAQTMKDAAQADLQEEAQLSLFPKRSDDQLHNRHARLFKIQAALKELEARKPENESKTPEKDQINFTDSQSRIMDTKTQGVIQGFNPQIAVDEAYHMIVGWQLSNWHRKLIT